MACGQPEQASHLFVSPHFDDAVLSCGGAIRQLVNQGHAVTVATAMGGAQLEVVPQSAIVDDLHRRWGAGIHPLLRRRQEDLRAIQGLGADFRHLPLLDCVYRMVDGVALYPSEASLFGDVHPLDDAASQLAGLDVLTHEGPQAVYLPLAVGNHVDHQIVLGWGRQLMRETPNDTVFRFYVEFPYSRAERDLSAVIGRTGMQLREIRFELSEAELRAKIDAIACYQSQISTFWESPKAMEAEVRRWTCDAETGRAVERYWQWAPGAGSCIAAK